MKSKEWDKIADNYFEHVSSPFDKGVKNPLPGMVRRMKGCREMSVIDLGTGIGNLIPFLEKKFGSVTAIDFSRQMLFYARKKSNNEATRFLQKDLTNLRGLYNQFDVAFAINSIVMPSVKDVKKSIYETAKVLKKGGKLIAIFPSLESVLYKAMIIYEYELKQNKRRSTAMRKTYKKIEREKYNFVLGFMEEEGMQKHFYRFEIDYRLRKAGFKNIEFEKVKYPWSLWEEKYLLRFKNKPLMWDWVVTAEK